jgi:HAD superfamily hydrolase (TIGR01484 family)
MPHGPDGSPILCIDFDGTLVDAQKRIHPMDVAILAEPARATVVPATGRPLHAVRRTLHRHGLFEGGPLPMPLVLEGGAVVYDPHETVRAVSSFEPAIQERIRAAMLATREITFHVFAVDRILQLWPSEAGDGMVERFELSPEPYPPDGPEPAWTKVVCIAATPEPLQAFHARIDALPLESAWSLPTVLEFTRAGIDKGHGLSVLLSDRTPGTLVAAAGDGGNDLPLFARATVTFAPADSPEEIRDAADHVFDARPEGVLTPMLRQLAREPG